MLCLEILSRLRYESQQIQVVVIIISLKHVQYCLPLSLSCIPAGWKKISEFIFQLSETDSECLWLLGYNHHITNDFLRAIVLY